jgi:hypothetical protein
LLCPLLRNLTDANGGTPLERPHDREEAGAIRTMVMSQPGVRLLDLLNSLHRSQADDVYQLILTDQVYVNLSAVRLTDYEHVQVFLDRDQAESNATLHPSSASLPRPSTLQLSVGAPCRSARFFSPEFVSGGTGKIGVHDQHIA